MIKAYIDNFLYILKHKYYVFIECMKMGLYFQAFLHDMSKFSFIEFNLYTKNFFKNPPDSGSFGYAWLHHQHKNKHHWNYWVVDAYKQTALQMPNRFAREMLCDWYAMAKMHGASAKDYYESHKQKMILHDNTRKFIERELGL